MLKALLPRTIWLIGISFSLIVLGVALIRYWLPQQEETTLKVANYNQYVTEAQKIGQVIKKKEKAAELVKLAEAKWRPYVETRTPLANTQLGGININVNPYQLIQDTKRYRNNVQRAVNKQLGVGGVKEIEGPRIPGVTDGDAPNGILASYYNYPAVPFPVVIYDLGQVQVKGTYEQIMKHVRSWSNMPRYLAITQGLALTGTAPTLTATYNLTIVGFIRHDGIFPPVPDGAPVGGAAPAGGMPGGRGGGAPFGGTSAPFGPPGGIPGGAGR
jgi:hypothetical protein